MGWLLPACAPALSTNTKGCKSQRQQLINPQKSWKLSKSIQRGSVLPCWWLKLVIGAFDICRGWGEAVFPLGSGRTVPTSPPPPQTTKYLRRRHPMNSALSAFRSPIDVGYKIVLKAHAKKQNNKSAAGPLTMAHGNGFWAALNTHGL